MSWRNLRRPKTTLTAVQASYWTRHSQHSFTPHSGPNTPLPPTRGPTLLNPSRINGYFRIPKLYYFDATCLFFYLDAKLFWFLATHLQHTPDSVPDIVMAYIVMADMFLAYIVMADIVMAYIFMADIFLAYIVMALYNYGRYSYGLYISGLYSYGPTLRPIFL